MSTITAIQLYRLEESGGWEEVYVFMYYHLISLIIEMIILVFQIKRVANLLLVDDTAGDCVVEPIQTVKHFIYFCVCEFGVCVCVVECERRV